MCKIQTLWDSNRRNKCCLLPPSPGKSSSIVIFVCCVWEKDQDTRGRSIWDTDMRRLYWLKGKKLISRNRKCEAQEAGRQQRKKEWKRISWQKTKWKTWLCLHTEDWLRNRTQLGIKDRQQNKCQVQIMRTGHTIIWKNRKSNYHESTSKTNLQS